MQRNAVFMALVIVALWPAAAPARDLNPGAPIADIPNFSVIVPDYTTFNGAPVPVTFSGTIAVKGAPAGPIKCPVSLEYDVNVKMSPTQLSPTTFLASPYSYVWAPTKSVAGAYDVTDGWPNAGTLSAGIVTSMFVTYKASTPPEGTAVTFTIDFGGKAGKRQLRVVSHVQCTEARMQGGGVIKPS